MTDVVIVIVDTGHAVVGPSELEGQQPGPTSSHLWRPSSDTAQAPCHGAVDVPAHHRGLAQGLAKARGREGRATGSAEFPYVLLKASHVGRVLCKRLIFIQVTPS